MNKKPVQTLKEMSGVIKSGTAEDKSSSIILNFLKFFNEVIWKTNEQSITAI